MRSSCRTSSLAGHAPATRRFRGSHQAIGVVHASRPTADGSASPPCVDAGRRSCSAPDSASRPRPTIGEPGACEPASRLGQVFCAGRRAVLPRVTLHRADGRPIQEPFLQQELWSPDGTVLTVLMHPGRVKTGLNAREEMGPILVAGDDVVLAFDGRPIKRWTVGPADANGPVVSAWKLSPVRVASKQPLVVTLDGPIDGRDADYLAIVDGRNRLVEGRARLKDGERTWTFTPHPAWQEGKYKLLVRGTLEDPAGNRLGSHFERSMNLPPEPATDAEIAFEAASCTESVELVPAGQRGEDRRASSDDET